VASVATAPDGEAADRVYEARFRELWSPPAPRSPVVAPTLVAVANLYLEAKAVAMEAGSIQERTFAEARAACEEFCRAVGDLQVSELLPQHFEAARAAWAGRFGPDRLKKYILLVRGMFRWACRPPLAMAPPNYGDAFAVPSRRDFRIARRQQRAEHGLRLFEPWECRLLLLAAGDVRFEAMILLGLHGMSQSDLAELPKSVIDLDLGIIDYARRKTGVDRVVALWPEAVAALAETLGHDRAGLAFQTRQGQPLVQGTRDALGMRFQRLCQQVGIYRRGRNFRSLRRTFRTLADEIGDQRAADLAMGHAAVAADMGAVYVQRVSVERLRRVADHVRARVLQS
jgi:integrase